MNINKKRNTLKTINKIKREKSILKVLSDANGDTYYSKSSRYATGIINRLYPFRSKLQGNRDEQNTLILNDFACIQFMSQFPELSTFVPRFHSGKKEVPSFIMTDVGPGRQLDKILLDRDYGLAEKALIGLMKTLAIIHKVTIGEESQFLKTKETLGLPVIKSVGKNHTSDFLNALTRMQSQIKMDAVSQDIEHEVREIYSTVTDNQRLLGLTHWDPCPDNCMLVDGTVKLYDFEAARYSNVLIDGLLLSNRFPTCWCFADIPQAIIDKAEKEYRKILGDKVPEINEDSYFLKQKAMIMAFWILQSIRFDDIQNLLEKDVPHGTATMRQRTLLRLEFTCQFLNEQNVFPAIARLLDQLNSELTVKWGKTIEKVKVYKALLED